MSNSFLSGFAEGAQTGLKLRDYNRNVQRQARQDRMAEETHATQQKQAGLQIGVLQGQVADRSALRDLGQLEYSLKTGTPSPQAQRTYERMFGHYGGNTDQAEADVTELHRAASSGEADHNTLQAFNRVYADEINQGGNDHKQVADLWPTENGVMAELEITRPDGSKYRAPMTSPNRNETDQQVAVIPWDTLFTDLKARKAALDVVRGRRVALGDKQPLTDLQTAETKQVERKHGLEDFVFKEDYKRKHGTGKSVWKTTKVGNGFISTNSQTGERRLPTAEEMKALGGSGKVQVVTFTDELGNKVPMERGPDGQWTPIVPEGADTADVNSVGPNGWTMQQAIDRATAMAEEKARWLHGDAADFPEGRQAFITRTAQEIYQGKEPPKGLNTGSEPAKGPSPQASGQITRTAQKGAKGATVPTAPTDVRQREIGKVYAAHDGRHVKWTDEGWELLD